MNAQAPAFFAPAELLTCAVVDGGMVCEHPVGQAAETAAAWLFEARHEHPEDALHTLRYSIACGIISYDGDAPEGVTYAVIADDWLMQHEFGQTLADAIHDHGHAKTLRVVRYDLRAGTIADVTEEAAAELLSPMDDEDFEAAPEWMQATTAHEREVEARADGDGWTWWDDVLDYRARVL